MNKNALIMIAKQPEINSVKTRLNGSMPDKERLALYVSMLESTVSRLGSINNADPFIAFAPLNAESYFLKFGLKLLPLPEGDLGERMFHAMNLVIGKGYEKTVLVGVDIPDLSKSIILNAFELLSDSDIVFGPAEDGGYYLVGFKTPIKEIFEGIQWSTDRALRQSIESASRGGYSIAFTKTLRDVDTPEDVQRAGFEITHS
ncbi:MAG TPA: glycosyltransferase [Nitrospirae bacterium]|nr:glycosyltransferase [Nitrospirota bacterium]